MERMLSEDFFFEGQVGFEIDLSRIDRCMTEPKGNDCTIDPGLKQLHGHRMAKHVGGNVLLSQGRTVFFRRGDVLGQEVSNSVATEFLTAGAGENH